MVLFCMVGNNVIYGYSQFVKVVNQFMCFGGVHRIDECCLFVLYNVGIVARAVW